MKDVFAANNKFRVKRRCFKTEDCAPAAAFDPAVLLCSYFLEAISTERRVNPLMSLVPQ